MADYAPLKTRLTDLLEIEHPIFCAGMGFVAVPDLVAAMEELKAY